MTTIHYNNDDYRISSDGRCLETWVQITLPYTGPVDADGEPTEDGYYAHQAASLSAGEWRKTWIKIGRAAQVISHTNNSPNSIRDGHDIPHYSLLRTLDGVPGNSNREITRYFGWRGTTDDISVDACGVCRILEFKTLRNGTISVRVGKPLAAYQD